MRRAALGAGIALLLVLGACTVRQPLPLVDGRPQVAVGDVVIVTFKDKSRAELKIREVRADGFRGETLGAAPPLSIEVRFADVVRMDKIVLEPEKNKALGWGAAIVVVGVALLVALVFP